ncbi:MAG: hypothetical protein AB8G99_07980 [Planctomycetaceae bacterium]
MTNEFEQWTTCDGELGTLVGELAQSRMKETILRRTCLGMVGGTLVVGTGVVLNWFDEKQLARPMSCRDVKSHTQGFLTKALDSEIEERFQQHLAKCAGCVRYVDSMRGKVAQRDQRRASVSNLTAQSSPANDRVRRKEA